MLPAWVQENTRKAGVRGKDTRPAAVARRLDLSGPCRAKNLLAGDVSKASLDEIERVAFACGDPNLINELIPLEFDPGDLG